MTGDPDVPPTSQSQIKQLTPSLCSCGCGRQATKASSYTWSYWCDPAVPAEKKESDRQLGGRRGLMTPAEVARLLEDADLDDREARQGLRKQFLSLRLAGRIGTGVYRDVLATVDGAAKDQERTPRAKPTAPLIVEVEKFSNGPESSS